MATYTLTLTDTEKYVLFCTLNSDDYEEAKKTAMQNYGFSSGLFDNTHHNILLRVMKS